MHILITIGFVLFSFSFLMTTLNAVNRDEIVCSRIGTLKHSGWRCNGFKVRALNCLYLLILYCYFFKLNEKKIQCRKDQSTFFSRSFISVNHLNILNIKF